MPGRWSALLFNSSALRFSEDVQQFLAAKQRYGALHGVVSHGPAKRNPHNPGLFHYGIHATEMLFTLMGPGCQQLVAKHTENAEVVTGTWADGRIGTLRGNRSGSATYGFLAFCENGVVHRPVSSRFAYRNLCREIVRSLETGEPSVANESSLEIVQFILAAAESERLGGLSVSLDSIR